MKKNWGLLVVLLLSFWAIVPLFHSGFFPIHDDTQVVRVQQMAQALRDGQFPVRWVGDLGYGFGYPIFNFYAPLAYYVGALFNLIGFDLLLATKLMMVLGILLSGVFMYFLAREFWGEIGGILSGLFYIYAPYHAVNVYVRGAVGEFWAMAFLPLIFYGLVRRSMIIGALGYAAVILSHNLTAMMVTPIVFIVSLLHRSIVPWLFGLGLSAFYWLPALSEMGLTRVFGQIGGGADFRDHFVFFDQLWASPWGFGGSAQGRLDGMSFMIGKLHIVLALFSLLTAVWLWQKKKKRSSFALFASFCVFAVAIFFTNKVSWPIWEAIPLLGFIQYPWRFLILATFAASFMVGSVMLWLKKNTMLAFIGGTIIILGLLFLNIKHFKPQVYLDVSAADYINQENIRWKTSKISDEYLPKDFPKPRGKDEVVEEKLLPAKEVTLSEIKLLSSRYEFKTKSQEESKILVKTAYFPGWKVFLDDKEIGFETPEGQILIPVSPGEHQVEVIFTNTLVRTAGNLISLIAILALIGGFIYERKNEV